VWKTRWDFFEPVPKIKQRLQTLFDVGLGYITLGQQSTTLSGGEAQRVKVGHRIK
jgi:excinuclease ABC subunit A